MKFTLKVIDDRKSGWIISNDISDRGGIDLTQRYAFNHLFPSGYCDYVMGELLWDMANLHGWDVEVTIQKD